MHVGRAGIGVAPPPATRVYQSLRCTSLNLSANGRQRAFDLSEKGPAVQYWAGIQRGKSLDTPRANLRFTRQECPRRSCTVRCHLPYERRARLPTSATAKSPSPLTGPRNGANDLWSRLASYEGILLTLWATPEASGPRVERPEGHLARVPHTEGLARACRTSNRPRGRSLESDSFPVRLRHFGLSLL